MGKLGKEGNPKKGNPKKGNRKRRVIRSSSSGSTLSKSSSHSGGGNSPTDGYRGEYVHYVPKEDVVTNNADALPTVVPEDEAHRALECNDNGVKQYPLHCMPELGNSVGCNWRELPVAPWGLGFVDKAVKPLSLKGNQGSSPATYEDAYAYLWVRAVRYAKAGVAMQRELNHVLSIFVARCTLDGLCELTEVERDHIAFMLGWLVGNSRIDADSEWNGARSTVTVKNAVDALAVVHGRLKTTEQRAILFAIFKRIAECNQPTWIKFDTFSIVFGKCSGQVVETLKQEDNEAEAITHIDSMFSVLSDGTAVFCCPGTGEKCGRDECNRDEWCEGLANTLGYMWAHDSASHSESSNSDGEGGLPSPTNENRIERIDGVEGSRSKDASDDDGMAVLGMINDDMVELDPTSDHRKSLVDTGVPDEVKNTNVAKYTNPSTAVGEDAVLRGDMKLNQATADVTKFSLLERILRAFIHGVIRDGQPVYKASYDSNGAIVWLQKSAGDVADMEMVFTLFLLVTEQMYFSGDESGAYFSPYADVFSHNDAKSIFLIIAQAVGIWVDWVHTWNAKPDAGDDQQTVLRVQDAAMALWFSIESEKPDLGPDGVPRAPLSGFTRLVVGVDGKEQELEPTDVHVGLRSVENTYASMLGGDGTLSFPLAGRAFYVVIDGTPVPKGTEAHEWPSPEEAASARARFARWKEQATPDDVLPVANPPGSIPRAREKKYLGDSIPLPPVGYDPNAYDDEKPERANVSEKVVETYIEGGGMRSSEDSTSSESDSSSSGSDSSSSGSDSSSSESGSGSRKEQPRKVRKLKRVRVGATEDALAKNRELGEKYNPTPPGASAQSSHAERHDPIGAINRTDGGSSEDTGRELTFSPTVLYATNPSRAPVPLPTKTRTLGGKFKRSPTPLSEPPNRPSAKQPDTVGAIKRLIGKGDGTVNNPISFLDSPPQSPPSSLEGFSRIVDTPAVVRVPKIEASAVVRVPKVEASTSAFKNGDNNQGRGTTPLLSAGSSSN